MKPMPDGGDFRLNEMITEDMVADEYDRKASCQLRFQQTSVEVNVSRFLRTGGCRTHFCLYIRARGGTFEKYFANDRDRDTVARSTCMQS